MSDESGPLRRRFDPRGHVVEVVARVESRERMKKTASVTLVAPPGKTFTVECDEGPYLSGDESAPPPLSFLTSSIAF